MCGIVGAVSNAPVNQLVYDALLLLQHRGQDAAGIVTESERKFFMHKAKGMVRDAFRTRNMRALPGSAGLGQVRYPTAGDAASEEEAQPFYVNAPFGVVMAHNGNLTNAQALKAELFSIDHRHINTDSDCEVLLNVLAHELGQATRGAALGTAEIFAAVRGVHRRVRGSYAVVALIAGHGLLAFRDPFGIRPLCFGRGADGTAPAPVLPPSAPPPLPPDMDQAIHAHRPRIMLDHWMAQVAARLHAVRPYRNMTITLSRQLQLDEGAALRRALPIRLTDIREVPTSAGGPAGRRLCHATLQLGARADASGAAGPLPLWVRFHVNVPRRVYTYRSPKPGPLLIPVTYLDAGPQLQAPPLPAAQRNTLLLLGIDARQAPPPLEPIELVQLHAMAALASDLERLTWGPSEQ